jgi:hypothetical protein
MKKALYPIILLMIITLQVNAQWTPNAAVNTPIGVRSGDQVVTKCLTHPSGYTWYAWFSLEMGNYNVRVQLTDLYGNKAFANDGLLISSNNSDTWVTDFDLAVDQDTCAIVVFQDIRAGNNEVYAYRVSPSGEQLWGTNGVRLSNSNGAADYSPKVCVTSEGNAVVVWEESSTVEKVILQKISPSGSKLWGSGIVMAGSGSQNYYMFPSIMSTTEDEVYVLWFKRGSSMYDPKHLYAQRVKSDGSMKWAADKGVFTSSGIPMIPSISLIPDTSDGFYVAWYDDRNNDWNYSTFVQHVDNNGTALFATNGVEAVVNNSNNHSYPSIALSPDGNDLYVFLVEMDGNQNQRGLYGQRISSSGTRLWTNSGKIFQSLSTLDLGMVSTRMLDNDVVVFYAKKTNLGSDQIKAMKIDSDGSYLWSGNGHVVVSSANGNKDDLIVGQYYFGQFIAAWSDQRSDNGDIYAQNITDDGTMGAQAFDLILNPDSLIFDQPGNDWIADGKYFSIKNPTSQTVVIDSMNMEGTIGPGAYWNVDSLLTFPLSLASGDSLWLNVKMNLITGDVMPGFVTDSLNIYSSLGQYVEIIMLDSIYLWDKNMVPDGFNTLSIFPNPAHKNITIQYYCSEPVILLAEIISSEGKILLLSDRIRSGYGENTLMLELPQLMPGIYTLRLRDNASGLFTAKTLIIN